MLAVIPARAGSRGIPRKNVRPFCGRPLLAWTVDAARKSGVCDRIVVSTDDEEIAACARDAGGEAPFLRPSEMARDDSPTDEAVAHAVREIEASDGWIPAHVLVLEPTAPFRRPRHVREAAELLVEGDADSVASVHEIPHHHHPEKALRRRPDGTVEGWRGGSVREMTHRRQELETSWAFDGLIFSCRTELVRCAPPKIWGGRVLGYPIDPRYAVDLDEPEDWAPAERRARELEDFPVADGGRARGFSPGAEAPAESRKGDAER